MSAQIELSAADARTLTDRIRTGAEVLWELIKQAYTSRAWAVLGYDTWDDYCTREFGTSRIKLPREDRQEVVSSMREIGMSTRAIASATGNDRKTIMSDVRELGSEVVQNGPPAPVTGTDGKTYKVPERPAQQPERQPPVDVEGVPTSGEVAPDEPDDDAPAPAWEHVGNIRPADLPALKQDEPAPPRRKPLTDDVRAAVYDMQKVIRKWESITSDDRFPANKKQVGETHLSDLHRAQSSLTTIISNFAT